MPILGLLKQEIDMNAVRAMALMAILALSACAGNTPRTNLDVSRWNPEKKVAETWTLSYVSQPLPGWTRNPEGLSANYLARKDIDPREMENVGQAERACRQYAKDTNPSRLASMSVYALLFGATGGIGLGAGALALNTASAGAYGWIGAATGVAAGVTNAVTSWDPAYAFAQCAGPILKSPNLILIGPYSQ